MGDVKCRVTMYETLQILRVCNICIGQDRSSSTSSCLYREELAKLQPVIHRRNKRHADTAKEEIRREVVPWCNKRTTALPIVQSFPLFDPLFQSTTSQLFGCILVRPFKPSFLDSYPSFVFHLRAKWQQVRIVTFCVYKRSLGLPCPLERTGTQLLLCCCFRLEPAETILADFTPLYVSCFL